VSRGGAGEVYASGALMENRGSGSLGGPPLAPWVAEPYRLWSLFEMIPLFAEVVAKAASALSALRRDFDNMDGDTRIAEDRRDQLIGILGVLRNDCEALGLRSSVAQIDRLRGRLAAQANLLHSDVREQLADLSRRFEDDLKATLCFFIPHDREKYWKANRPFGPDVFARFSSTRIDLEEAGNCLACRRSTAAVFHLMRVMEVGLRALGATLNDPYLDPGRNRSWEKILRGCNAQLREEPGRRVQEWQDDPTFFAGATATLMAVKDAWRNPTMHVEINYDDERALDVWNAVGGFMRHLATKLSDPVFTPPEEDPSPSTASGQGPPSSPGSS